MSNLTIAVILYLSYLLGSISSAILVCKIMRLPDPRTQGSRNPGATNVLRIGGKKAAFFTLLGDLLKGLIPVLLAKYYGVPINSIILVAFAAFLGHLFPIFFRFEGGKGVATLLGCLLGLSWLVGSCWMITWLLMAVLFRYSSLAALTASLLTPVYIWYFTGNSFWVLIASVMIAMLFYRHRANIMKLVRGEERKIGEKKL